MGSTSRGCSLTESLTNAGHTVCAKPEVVSEKTKSRRELVQGPKLKFYASVAQW
jgi:hypothetical protein